MKTTGKFHNPAMLNASKICPWFAAPSPYLRPRAASSHADKWLHMSWQPLTLKMQASMAGRRADVARAEQHNPAVIHLLSALFDNQTHEGSWYLCSHSVEVVNTQDGAKTGAVWH